MRSYRAAWWKFPIGEKRQRTFELLYPLSYQELLPRRDSNPRPTYPFPTPPIDLFIARRTLHLHAAKSAGEQAVAEVKVPCH